MFSYCVVTDEAPGYIASAAVNVIKESENGVNNKLSSKA